MPRIPRIRRASGSLEPSRVYHVTNRGVARYDLFDADRDRIVFLMLLAEACVRFGSVCHAACLMTNHFHLVIKDARGVLSLVLHHVEGGYARYFNDLRAVRRRGPLFESRFCAELIDSEMYFQDTCAYVFLNPVSTLEPMAPSPQAYCWSTAALFCSDITPVDFVARLLEPFGGGDGVLDALPPTRRTSSLQYRRERLDALASGAWFLRDRVLAGRSGEQYRRELSERIQP